MPKLGEELVKHLESVESRWLRSIDESNADGDTFSSTWVDYAALLSEIDEFTATFSGAG